MIMHLTGLQRCTVLVAIFPFSCVMQSVCVLWKRGGLWHRVALGRLYIALFDSVMTPPVWMKSGRCVQLL
jgi:hypothetical protein